MIELWAGPECSVVRVGDRYVDEIELTGHAQRLDDLDALAALGVSAIRQPVLWERTHDWTFADERLARLHELGVRPIVGLVHHGSGPPHTSLLEDSFVTGLADFARRVAERYPWVRDFTPVNEPNTTARFSALYGHWYPHARSERDFVRALIVECEATRAAMHAVRAIIPDARLVQTEDLGTVSATPQLAYQAEYENRRRFLSLDLLTGKIDRTHPLFDHLVALGAPPDVLASFVDDPCPPDVVGLNHYVTSDRFLDGDLAKYPPHVHGGNLREAYADVEAVRVAAEGIPGHRALLDRLWDRYAIPLAITEVHIGCTPEEQIRWLDEAWRAAVAAQSDGVDVRAVTAWAAFGAYDWDSLLTNPRRRYEPGLFDVRSGRRPTALATVARELATEGASRHPALDEPGWWRRPERIVYPAIGRVVCGAPRRRRPILVTGARGTLGRAIARIARDRGLHAVALARPELDIADEASVAAAIEAHRPWAIVSAAGYVRVDDAERDVERCFRANAHGARVLAEACVARGVRLVTFSSDLVFDGTKRAPYLEDDRVAPLGVYGESKAAAERLVLARNPDALVVRTSAFFGPWDEANFVVRVIADLRGGRVVHAAANATVSPTYMPDLAHATLTLLVDGASGIVHLATAGATTWLELARRAADLAGLPRDRIRDVEAHASAARPPYSVLGSARTALMPPLDDALARFAAAYLR